MKQRFSSLDVKVIAHELHNSLVSLRLSNIYDLSSKIFLLKFASPTTKHNLLLDSGFRTHLTSFARTTSAFPSPFVQRLRKYLKTRRVTAVRQIGTDRILELEFSGGQYRLFLEFYAGGNVVLTDAQYAILALLRIVHEGEAQEELRVGLKYDVENKNNSKGVPALTKERLEDALKKAVDREEGATAGKKMKKKPGDALRKALALSITEYPPILVEHALLVAGFDSTLKPSEVLEKDELLDDLLKSFQEAQRVVEEITSSQSAKGYIIAKVSKNGQQETDDQKFIYDDFHPYRPRQFEDDPTSKILEFEGFNTTVDEFFSSIEGQKLESRLQEREINAKKKLEAARADQQKRVGALQEVQELNIRKAGAIEANVERIQEAMDAVNGLIAQGMDWVEIAKLIELEQKRNNPVAEIIKLPLKLHENTITLLLGEEQVDEEESGDETGSDVSDSEDEKPTKPVNKRPQDTRLVIDIDLGITPWANAGEYYDQKRSAAAKEQKTVQSSTKALKSTEKKIEQDLKKDLKQEKAVLRPVRRQMWFEKFIWFISSDGYLVTGGRDAQQNEILYKKYLRKGDVYCHADLQGAASIVIRNNSVDAPIPPGTLSQAGTLAVATSNAWDSKAGMAAWWVNADQVSKSAPTGDFLPAGSFMVRGEKNFLPPAQLLLGFGVVFRISEESKAKHLKHRIHDEPVADPASTVASTPLESANTTVATSETSVEDDNAKNDGGYESEHNGADDQESDDGQAPNDANGDEDGRSDSSRPNPLQSQAAAEDASDHEDSQQDSPESREQSDELASPDEVADNVNQLEIKDSQEDDEPAETSAETAPTGNIETVPSTKAGKGKSTPASAASQNKGPPQPKRGQRSKQKKIAQKYKDQDEEDRIAAQSLIGAAAGLAKAKADAEAKAAKEAEAAFHKERRRAQHLKTQQQTAKHEEVRKLMLEEGVEVPDEAEEEMATSLDAFVGTPLPGDEILEAIPVCAPWVAMGKYKYKAKLQPGAQKKGKAVKEILGRWVSDSNGKGAVDESARDVERMWPREVELIKGWKPEEIINTVPVSKVRVMMAGGSAGAASKGAPGKSKGGKGGKKR